MEYLLAEDENKKFVVNINHEQIGDFFLETQTCKLPISPVACGRLLSLRSIILEKFYKLKNNFLIFYKEHLYGNLFLVIESPFECVQLRRFHELGGFSIPTEEGISLKECQWSVFMEVLEGLYQEYAVLQIASQCGVLHQNQEDASNCALCCWDFEDEDDLNLELPLTSGLGSPRKEALDKSTTNQPTSADQGS